jgi:Fic family protein
MRTHGRTFERTHPWISFTVDVGRFTPKALILLGRAAAKCELMAGVPLSHEVKERMHTVYLAKGARATTAIEGNTLSLAQVLKLIAGTLDLPPSKRYLEQEVDNIIDMCNEIGSAVFEGSTPEISPQQIAEFNRRVLKDVPLENDVIPGAVRRHSVGVRSYRGAPAEDCAYLLDRLCEWLRDMDDVTIPGAELAMPIVKAILAHLYIAWIHPFGDGNGRTARLMEFTILLDAGVPAPAAHLLSNHYNETRSEYYRQLDNASASDYVPFLEYALQGFVDGLREQFEAIRKEHRDVAWKVYCRGVLETGASRAIRRRILLVEALSNRDEPVPRKELMRTSVDVAEAYSGRTPKTLARDLNLLEKLELISLDADGVRARKERMDAFAVRRRPRQSHVRPGGTE